MMSPAGLYHPTPRHNIAFQSSEKAGNSVFSLFLKRKCHSRLQDCGILYSGIYKLRREFYRKADKFCAMLVGFGYTSKCIFEAVGRCMLLQDATTDAWIVMFSSDKYEVQNIFKTHSGVIIL